MDDAKFAYKYRDHQELFDLDQVHPSDSQINAFNVSLI